MRLEAEAVDKLGALIQEALAGGDADSMVARSRPEIPHCIWDSDPERPAGRSLNLPLFSRISLMRGMKTLQLMDVPGSVHRGPGRGGGGP